jgi:putative nucleotidyltransferase with HDIG domain
MNLDDKIKWGASQPWAEAMRNCAQDPVWHGEGDAWTHTQMVCASLKNVSGFEKLSENDREVLEWAALLHDVSKPDTSVVEDGRIRCPHHAEKSVPIARRIMEGNGVSFDVREAACRIIRWHMMPTNFENCEDPAYFVVFTSWLCRNDLLYVLSVADCMGRESQNKSETLDWIEYWREECEKFFCYSSPYKFFNEKARFDFYEKRSFMPYYCPRFMPTKDVIMLCGLPGVGKTTYAMNRYPTLNLVELDKTREEMGIGVLGDSGRVQQATKEKCRELLRAGKPFVFSAVNFVKKNRRSWVSLFMAYGARVKIVYMECPDQILIFQNKNREKSVPEHVIMSMKRRFEIPTWDECHELELMYRGVENDRR